MPGCGTQFPPGVCSVVVDPRLIGKLLVPEELITKPRIIAMTTSSDTAAAATQIRFGIVLLVSRSRVFIYNVPRNDPGRRSRYSTQ